RDAGPAAGRGRLRGRLSGRPVRRGPGQGEARPAGAAARDLGGLRRAGRTVRRARRQAERRPAGRPGPADRPVLPGRRVLRPAGALAEGKAVLAVLTLGELARLPREGRMVSTRFGIGPQPPAARAYFDPAGKPVARLNYVPYFAGGRLGVVRTRCPRPEAAFDLLADLGGPARRQDLVREALMGGG